jgi:hypothetical protein
LNFSGTFAGRFHDGLAGRDGRNPQGDRRVTEATVVGD